MYELLKCVTDLIRREFSVEGGCSRSLVSPPPHSSPEMAPVKWFDACCKGATFC